MATTKVDHTIRITIDLATKQELDDLWVIFSIYFAHLSHWPTNQAKDLVFKIGQAAGVTDDQLDQVLERMNRR